MFVIVGIGAYCTCFALLGQLVISRMERRVCAPPQAHVASLRPTGARACVCFGWAQLILQATTEQHTDIPMKDCEWRLLDAQGE